MPTDGKRAGDSPFTAVRDGVTVAIRLTPRARREGLLGVEAGPDGALRCRVAVNAPPVEGQANAALLRLLAKAWGVPRSRLAIVAGAGARDKVVKVAGDPAALLGRLKAWREGRDG